MLCALSPVRSAGLAIPRSRAPSRSGPCLRFDPLAWLKLQFFATTWDCAVGGFGLAGGDDSLHVERFITVPQQVTPHAVHFDGPVSAPSRARRRRRRSRPQPQSSRVLILTHPGSGPAPTDDDERLFASTLRQRDWSALVVVSRNGGIDARLAMSSGPVRSLPLAVEIDWAAWARFIEDQSHYLPRLTEAWKDEYARNIRFANESHANPIAAATIPSRHHRLFRDDEVAVVLPQARRSARQLQRS